MVSPNTIKLIEGKVDKDFSGTGECMIASLCAKQGVLLPFIAVTLDDNPGISQSFPIQVTNLSNNFVTFREDFPLGSIKEVHEVIEADDDEVDENTHPSPAQSSAPMASARTAYNIRNCSPSANAEEPSPESIPSPENAQEDISYPKFPTDMKDAQEWLQEV